MDLTQTLDGNHLIDLIGANVNLIDYDTLRRTSDVMHLLNGFDCAIVFYMFEKDGDHKIGHWTLIFMRDDGTIEFFDSYGHPPDEELDYIDDDFIDENNMEYPLLMRLLYNKGDDIEYNNYIFQKDDGVVATCGRWCALRYWFKDMNIDEFKGMIEYVSTKSGYNPDEVAYILTEDDDYSSDSSYSDSWD